MNNKPGFISRCVSVAMVFALSTAIYFSLADAGYIANSSGGGGGGASAFAPTAVKTANYNAAASDYVLCDTNAVGAFTVTLPTAPADKAVVGIKLVTQGATNAVTFACGGSDHINTAAGPTTGTVAYLNEAVQLQYVAATSVWIVMGSDTPPSLIDARTKFLAAQATLGQ